ncbi:MAG: DUF4062 domain-containing protein [Dehalococcoidales bacterium]|nr:DUF4062 domain-containing protein [Dehalococcoidales bacterium]
MTIKYEIFVSSTYEDLKNEREQVIKAILEMGHLPVGMEMFSAADEQQWLLIKRQIDECDYYIVIIAHRYGSMDGNLSYTEKEYDYAVSRGIPTMGFIIDEETQWPHTKIDTEQEKLSALKSFKEKVKQKNVGFWKSNDDLYGKIPIALIKQINTNPRTGWVRGSEISSTATTNELTRLSKENDDLRKRLDAALISENLGKKENIQNITRILNKNRVIIVMKFNTEPFWRNVCKISYYDMFKIIAPYLNVECSDTQAALVLTVFTINEEDKIMLDHTTSIPLNHITAWLADFAMLGLVESSKKRHEYKDTTPYWSFTQLGREVYRFMRITELEAGISDVELKTISLLDYKTMKGTKSNIRPTEL